MILHTYMYKRFDMSTLYVNLDTVSLEANANAFEVVKSAKIYICYLPGGRSVWKKTVPEVLSTARGRRLRAVLKTKGSVFSHTDRPSPVNNIFIFFPAVNWFYRVLMHGFVYATLVIESACAPSSNDL